MMYRLNVQQHQQQQQQQQEQQQQQQHQQTTITTTQQSAHVHAHHSQQSQQVIPSHIILQQQLNAAAAAASIAANPAISLHPATSNNAITQIIVNNGETIGGLNGGLQHNLQHPIQQQQQQQQQQRTNTATISTSSVEDKLKLLTTAIKTEPLHDVITLTATTVNNANINNNNNNNKNSTNNNNGSNTNIIALTVTPTNSNAQATAIVLPVAAHIVNKNTTTATATIKATATALPLTSSTTTSSASVAAATTNNNCMNNLKQSNTLNLVVNSASGNGSGSASVSNSSAAAAPSTSSAAIAIAAGIGNNSNSSNGHLVFVPNKRARMDNSEDWISTPSPGSVPSSAPPLSPSPGSQNHSYSANMSNGYASPMSAGSYDPYSPNGKQGRDDLSPSSSLNGYSTNDGCDAKKSKKGPAPRLQEELCLVCGDRASGYHYNALTCEGCKGFFRRSVTKNAVYSCKFGRACEMDMYMRRKCQECRLKKCLAVGMRPECVVPENQCAMKRREKKAQKEKDKQQASPSAICNTEIKQEILDLMTCDQQAHPTFPLLPADIMAKCQARNIPPLTYNQLAVIYKLIWYQDGYEQPSEDDLKRIMSSPDENESQTDVSFRHITEITILTVQLIVEFAKGLPAFTKIPQEDQITLLKACSSEVMMLRMARRYDHSSDSIFFANNRSYTRDSYKMAGMADNIEDLLHFCRQMYSMKVDNVEYALLTAIVIFSDRPGLEMAELVEAIQSYYIDTLRIYILNRHCGDPMSLVFFAKLLSILTELRTLGNQNAEMCFSLKLKNRKLPKFLEEIWDVHAIPPSVQSHLQATQAEREQSPLRNEATTSATASTSTAAAAAAAAAASVSAAIAASTATTTCSSHPATSTTSAAIGAATSTTPHGVGGGVLGGVSGIVSSGLGHASGLGVSSGIYGATTLPIMDVTMSHEQLLGGSAEHSTLA